MFEFTNVPRAGMRCGLPCGLRALFEPSQQPRCLGSATCHASGSFTNCELLVIATVVVTVSPAVSFSMGLLEKSSTYYLANGFIF